MGEVQDGYIDVQDQIGVQHVEVLDSCVSSFVGHIVYVLGGHIVSVVVIGHTGSCVCDILFYS